MNAVLKTFLSMSFSGGLLILAMLFGKRYLKDRISRQWQYYIWLVAILRLLLPFGPETSLLGKAYQAVDQAITIRAVPLPTQSPIQNTPGDVPAPAVDLEPNNESVNLTAEALTTARPLQDIGTLLTDHIWLVWLVVTLVLLIRKVTIYQDFMRYIRAGLTQVSDIPVLDWLSVAQERADMKKPIELCVNPMISSPLLIGFLHPCIVLPGTEYSEKDFQYIVLHELTHHKRKDMFYKWLVQITVCLHWFNPLVHLMSREITKACEFSCDEAVLAAMGSDSAQDYGKTLLDAMASVRKYRENLGSVTLSENKQLLKERLGAIMKFKKPSKTARMATAALTLCVIFGAAFLGVYSVAAADVKNPADAKKSSTSRPDHFAYPRETDKEIQNRAAEESLSEIEQYYEADSLPLFQIAFSRLDEESQDKWLNKIYADDQIMFWGAAAGLLDEDCDLIRRYAEKIYGDDNITYFSVLAMHMSEDILEEWLDRALEDGKWNFQSMLFNLLERDDELNELEEKREKEWEEAQMAEYEAAGITIDGKEYYYQGQLVNVFLDIRANKSFYTLNMNPKGTVNIKVIRDENNKITGVAYMSDAEVAELFENDEEKEAEEEEAEDWQEIAGGRIWHPLVIPVNMESVADGEIIWLGEYTLTEGDRIWYAVYAETGNGMQVGFAEPEDEFLDTVYYSVENQRQKDETLECVASMTLRSPVKPGTYKLFLQATDGPLENVRGNISIGFAADAH